MSAWLVSDVHLSAMVQAACVEGLIPFTEADMWWQEAKWQNLYALNQRYGDDLPSPDPRDIEVDRTNVEAELDPAVIISAIGCWGYQCAEFNGYDQTKVSLLFEALRTRLELRYPELPESDNWGITEWDEVTRPMILGRHLRSI